MKNTLIKKLEAWRPCQDAVVWLGDQTLEEAFSACQRADWMLWAYANLYPDNVRELTLAKGHCVNLIRDLLVDEHSIAAIDAAIAFGEGRITRGELVTARAGVARAGVARAAVAAAAAAARVAAVAAAAAAARATHLGSAAAAAGTVYLTGTACAAKIIPGDNLNPVDAYEPVRLERLAEMANICRKYLQI